MNRLKSINVRTIAKYALLVLWVIIGALMEWVTMGESAQLDTATQNLNNAQLQLMTVQTQYAKLDNEVKQGKQQNTASSARLSQMLPKSLGITEVLLQMTKLALANGITLNSFTFANSNNPSSNAANQSTISLSSLPYVDVNITVSGSTSHIKKFINDLENQSQITAIQSFSLGNGSTSSGTVAINLWLYYQ